MKHSFKTYMKEAFNYRPLGMFLPPNWALITAIGIAGTLIPGLWLIGAGLELALVLGMANSKRFQRLVDAKLHPVQTEDWQKKAGELLNQLPAEDKARHTALVERCGAILDQQRQSMVKDEALQHQSESLGRLAWIYLRLLLMRNSIENVLRESEPAENMEERLSDLQARLKDAEMTGELRKSLGSQAEILKQRIDKQKEGRSKLTFLHAELERIEQQVELIREQSALTGDANQVADRIDMVSSTLGATTEWIGEQQSLLNSTLPALEDAPPLPVRESAPPRVRSNG